MKNKYLLVFLSLIVLYFLQIKLDQIAREKGAEINEVLGLVFEDSCWVGLGWRFDGVLYDKNRLLYDKVTVLESEKRAWDNSPEAQALRDALNPWKNHDSKAEKDDS